MKNHCFFLSLTASALLGMGATLPVSAQPAPIASWSFDKREGEIYRGVGKGILTRPGAVGEPGVISGNVTAVADGKKNGAVSFAEQAPGFIRIPVDLSPIAAQGFTIAFWLRPGGQTSSYGTCVDFGGSKGFVIRLNNADRLSLSLGSKWNVITTTERLVDPSWIHVALTFDGAVTRFYVGGVEVGSDPGMDVTKLDATLFLGAVEERVKSPDGSSNLATVKPLFGDLDEFEIYSQALSPAEIAKASATKFSR